MVGKNAKTFTFGTASGVCNTQRYTQPINTIVRNRKKKENGHEIDKGKK